MTDAFESLVSAFHRRWPSAERAARPALVAQEAVLSYGALAARVGALAGGLRAAGIREGDRVAIAVPRSMDLACALLATLAAGACPCVLEPGLGPEETARRFAATGMTWLLHDRTHRDDPGLAAVAQVRRIAFESLSAEAQPYWAHALQPGDCAYLLFTSGSSGRPKGVLQSHLGLRVNADGIVGRTGLGPQDRLLHTMPLHHTNGVNNQLLAPLLAGAAVVLAERFKAQDMPALMAQHRPTVITGVPTMYSRMLAFEFPPAALAALRMARCGSAPITEALHRQVEEKLGVPLVVSYGLSEATCTSTMNPPLARRVGSVGTVLPGQRVFLAGRDGAEIEDPRQEGEICIGGPSLMLGYLEEGAAGRPAGPGPVLRTGDLGRFDAQGYLYITGRIKDVIIRGGENLSPHLIEGVLAKVPGVRACCVVGRPDADLGEVPCAFVVRTADGPGRALTQQHLTAAVLGELSRVHAPVAYYYVDALPENSVGKVDRKSLKAALA
ncbi:Short-chain-fatty-acid--CoA ligase [Delftia tsuruhatensis]|uniref:class I adenylate-forming enzyme family protein n=1 Tax=Delftia tsuruhatensis TaxID=180282 RepID=UPI001E6D9B44|nr:class I adenylate-forming enzyme family protein [Delftia tsuruhatensis]CAB5702161.1 Short-chain-fatty-acid--CoA ligase [Delftia tsuruhatensis]CAC9691307.1 Short-chain-fatty-acid--CoA ligase [Delftia tsuruhatensis]